MKRKERFIVQDVSEERNYLVFRQNVKLEMVARIINKGEIVRELDIDSHDLSRFVEDERRLLEGASKIVSFLLYRA